LTAMFSTITIDLDWMS